MDKFVVFDVETANPYERGSICQIGVALFDGNTFSTVYNSLIDPQTEFHPICTQIHGIMPTDVRGKPTFAEVLPTFVSYLTDYIVVAHNAVFDISALERAIFNAELDPISVDYFCSLTCAKKVFPHMPCYKLNYLCDTFSIPLHHHDALADARACGEIILRAAEQIHASSIWELACLTGTNIHNTLTNTYDPCNALSRKTQLVTFQHDTDRCIDPSTVCFSGKKVVLTGELSYMTRTEATAFITEAGGSCMSSVSRMTDYLIVGTQDLYRTNGKTKSCKHRKADQINAAGGHIVVLSADEFKEIVLSLGGNSDA